MATRKLKTNKRKNKKNLKKWVKIQINNNLILKEIKNTLK